MLYSSIGHAGASGYMAVMAILSFTPDAIKPTSLILNIIVSAIASYQFIRAGYFDKKLFLSFILASVPSAFIGGWLSIPASYFKVLAGIFLIVSAGLLFIRRFILVFEDNFSVNKKPAFASGIIVGALIGLFSGLIGVGGGIFLTPILILKKWSDPKTASGISALFIFCNSIAGLLGHYVGISQVDSRIIYWVIAVVAGGVIGSFLGTKKFNTSGIIIVLTIVLVSAGIKMILSVF